MNKDISYDDKILIAGASGLAGNAILKHYKIWIWKKKWW